MNDAPILVRWSGEVEAFLPLPHFRKRCNATFVDTEIYRMAVEEERSAQSHRHYFATVFDAWQNLPADQAERFQSSEHLRKFALIKCGYSDQRQIVCASKAEAMRLRAFIAPMDDYAIVTAVESVVTVFTAKSQSTKAMGRREFGESKQRVLDYVSQLLGVSTDDLQRSEAA